MRQREILRLRLVRKSLLVLLGICLLSLFPGVSQVEAVTDYWVQSNQSCAQLACFSFNTITGGNDSNNCTASGTPCLTMEGVLDKVLADCAYSCPGVTVHVRGTTVANPSAYILPHGLMKDDYTDTRIPSGTSANNLFTIQAEDGDYTALFYRNPVAGALTVQQMQGPNCVDLGNNVADCVGFPTLVDCQHLANWPGASADAGYPHSCVSGTGNNNGDYNGGGWWEFHDRTGQVLLEGVIEATGEGHSGGNTYYNNGHQVRWVKFRGIVVDSRGVLLNTWRSASFCIAGQAGCGGTHINGDMTARDIYWVNSEWRNAAASCLAQPATNEVDATGADNYNHFNFTGGKYHHCGIPYNTYQINGVNARNSLGAVYLHWQYVHVAGQVSDGVECYFNAGDCFTIGNTDIVKNSYIHDTAFIGIQASFGNTIINNVLVNNGGSVIQGAGCCHGFGNPTLIANNTFVRGNTTADAIQVGTTTPNWTIENNIFDGFNFAVVNYWASSNGAPIIRNNLVTNNTSNAFQDFGGSGLVLSNNIVSQDATQPKFTDKPNRIYTLQSGSLAIDNGITETQTSTDYTGAPRPVGCCWDMGAFEFGSVIGPSAPDTVINTATTDGSTQIGSSTTATTAQFTYSGIGGTSPYTFGCQLDGSSFTSCTTQPKTYSGLSLAQHTFCVRATGNDSLTDASPACFTWTITANSPPTATINTGPAATTSSTDATFTFSATGCTSPCQFQCILDGANTQSFNCTSPVSYTNLSSTCNSGGTTCNHNFTLRAFDPSTNLVSSPASFSWVVVQSGGGTFAVNTCVQIITSTLNLRDSWPNGAINFQNSLNDIEKIVAQDSTPNPSGFPGLQVNTLTGANAGLNGKWHSTGCTSFSCSSNTITSVTCPGGTAPDTTITSSPAASTTMTSATFVFTGTGGTSPYTYECNLDSAGFSSCTTPQSYSGLSVAAHNFKVRAIGADNLTDPSPASFDWTITSATPVFTQSDSRFYGLRNDANGNQVAYGTTALSVTRGGRFFVGLEVSITVGNPGAQGFLLYYSKNGGSYTAMPDTCGADHICFYGISDTSSDIKADGSAVPTCISSSNTVVGGAVSRRVASVLTPNLIQNSCVQLRWGLKFDGSETAGDTYDFRVRKQDTTVINTYTVTPRVTSIASQASGGF